MHCSDREHALSRLANAPYRSRTTDIATELILQNPSETALIQGLFSSRTATGTLEAFSAIQSESDAIFDAVQSAISRDPCKSWALLESLHRLPWYGGIRAFLSLPDPPQSSPSAYAFFILARNKIFIAPHIDGDPFNRCFHAMWRLVSAAKTGDWQDPDDGIITVIEMIETHLNRPAPDEFIVYFAALVLGRMGPVDLAIQDLRNHAVRSGHPTVRRVAALALRHLRVCLPRETQWHDAPQTTCPAHGRSASGILMRLAAVPLTVGIVLTSTMSFLFGHASRRQRPCQRT